MWHPRRMSQTSPAESSSTRFNIEADIVLRLIGDRPVAKIGRVKNMSGTGFYALADLDVPVGSLIEFAVRMPVGSCSVKGRGKLIWRKVLGDSTGLGVAIRHYTLE